MPQKIGKYTIIRQLGEGGMSIVWEGIEENTQQRVAIKVLKHNLAPETDAVHRFHREIETSKALSHANIIPILDVGEENGTHYYVMPLIQGRTLEQILEHEKISIDLAAHIAIQIALGLQYAHKHGVIHRDIKPSNIMITETQVFIMDFGLARPEWVARLTLSGTLLGTPSYMSPEQIQGLCYVDQRTDIYSLGVTLYQMLTGHLPFSYQNLSDLMYNILYISPIPPHQWNKDIPANLESIVLKAMHKNPDRRFESDQQLINALYKFLCNKHKISTTITQTFYNSFKLYFYKWKSLSIFFIAMICTIIIECIIHYIFYYSNLTTLTEIPFVNSFQFIPTLPHIIK